MPQKSLEERVAVLEEIVRSLCDDKEIRELLARYGYTADTCRDDDYVELYTADGVMDLSTGGRGRGGYEGVVRWEGQAQIRDFISDPKAHHRPGFYGNSMHVQGNNLVTHIDGSAAIANSYSLVLEGQGAGVELISAGNNQWRLEKVDGRWRIKERRRRQVGDDEYAGNLDASLDARAD